MDSVLALERNDLNTSSFLILLVMIHLTFRTFKDFFRISDVIYLMAHDLFG